MKRGEYIPKARKYYIFDWTGSNDGKANYVVIIEKIENGKVYTVEKSSTGDTCKQKQYDINGSAILGYGTPQITKRI